MALQDVAHRVRDGARRAGSLARKELAVHARLHRDVLAVLHKMEQRSPALAAARAKAYGFAVFPSVARASAVLGGAYGLGEVYARGHLVGYAGLVQLTVGVQLGGDTFSQLVLFDDRAALEKFKKGKVGLAAGASAALARAGAGAGRRPPGGSSVHLQPVGGLMVEGALGAQKVVFAPAVLTRLPGFLGDISKAVSSFDEGVMAKDKNGKLESMGQRAASLRAGGAKVAVRARDGAVRAGARSREAVTDLRDRLPSAEEIKKKASRAGGWTRDQIGDHPVAVRAAAVAAGIAGAALIPVSDREREAVSSASRKVKQLARDLGNSPTMTQASQALSGWMSRSKSAVKSLGSKAKATSGASAAKPGAKARATAKRASSAGKKTTRSKAAAKKSRAAKPSPPSRPSRPAKRSAAKRPAAKRR
jgi:hypothetical protein